MPIMSEKELEALEKQYNHDEPDKIEPKASKKKKTPKQCIGCKYLGKINACYSCVNNPNKEV